MSLHDGGMRSLTGAQATLDSRQRNAPSYGFGTSDRNSVQVIYGGGRASANPMARSTKLSPGPIYMPEGNDKGPKFSFGGKGNGISAGDNRRAGVAPGPGEYELSGAVGNQVASISKTAPAYGWAGSTSQRETLGTPSSSERAGCDKIYETTVALGPQAAVIPSPQRIQVPHLLSQFPRASYHSLSN